MCHCFVWGPAWLFGAILSDAYATEITSNVLQSIRYRVNERENGHPLDSGRRGDAVGANWRRHGRRMVQKQSQRGLRGGSSGARI